MSKPKITGFHKPVMVSEVLSYLNSDKYAHLKSACFVDATVGLGGHAKEFVKNGNFVIGIDRDVENLRIAEEVLNRACPTPYRLKGTECFKLLHGNFKDIYKLVKSVWKEPVLGVYFDLGISSRQLDDDKRGFSFKYPDAQLDMRFDISSGVKASDLLAVLDGNQLENLFVKVLPRQQSRLISEKIIVARKQKQIKTVSDLLNIIRPVIRKRRNINLATLPFLALRMAVNSEIEDLEKGLEGAFELIDSGGRIAVISFHSVEDRIVKKYFVNLKNKKMGKLITKKPIIPSKDELVINRRSRSAKLRVIEKI